MRNLFIVGFVVMIAAQWYVPISMIRGVHEVIDEGVELKFKTQPVDPSDPFRGKYVTLNFDQETYHPKDTNEMHFETGQKVFATLFPDSAGFMKVIRLTQERPEAGIHYINVTFRYSSPGFEYEYGDGKVVNPAMISLDFPFKRFYVEESKASDAEQIYWGTRTDSTQVCYAKVKVHNGKATLIDVMINDRPLMDIVKEINSED